MFALDRFRLAAIRTVNLGRRFVFGCQWTPRAIQTMALAQKAAAALGNEHVYDTHFTLALGRLGDGMPADQLKHLGFHYETALAQARSILGPGTARIESVTIPLGEGVERLIAIAKGLSLSHGLACCGTDHLFLALLQVEEKLLRQLIETKGLGWQEFRSETEGFYGRVIQNQLLHPEPTASEHGT